MGVELGQSWWAVAFYAGPVVLCISGIVLSVYISWRYLDEMVNALKGSRQFSLAARSLETSGWVSRFILATKISGAVAWPRAGIRAGLLDASEIENFPSYIRRLIRLNNFLTYVMLVWGGVACLLISLGE